MAVLTNFTLLVLCYCEKLTGYYFEKCDVVWSLFQAHNLHYQCKYVVWPLFQAHNCH